MILIRSQSLDPYRNLAIEEVLLDRDRDEGPLLFLWRAADTVVIGKNQNPWQECDFAQMRECGVRLARRNTGGGAVYHDEGNLNFALLCARNKYNRNDVYDAVIRAVGQFDIVAVRMGKSSLAVGNHKISGNAFAYRRDTVLHHGTVLVHANLSRFSVLKPPAGLAIETRAVRSEPAVVANLADLQPGIDIDAVAAALIESFAETWGPVEVVRSEADLDVADIDDVAAHHQSREWLIGHGPDFTILLTGTVTEGEIRSSINGMNGRIAEIRVSGIDLDTAQYLRDRLTGQWFVIGEIRGVAAADASTSSAQEALDWIGRFAM